MDNIDKYRDILHQSLSAQTKLMNKLDRITSTVIVIENRNHFMVINEGWEGKRRIHSLVFHAEIRNDKL